MKPIDADAYMEKVRHEAKAMPQKQGETFVILSEWIMEKTPSIEPKRGKWIDRSGGIEGAWNYCSVCGEQAIDLYDFCPNCGADMRGTDDDDRHDRQERAGNERHDI